MRAVAPALLVAVLLFPARLRAADAATPSTASQPAGSPRRADFLFRAPRGFVGVRGGVQIAAAGGGPNDIYSFLTGLLTLQRSDFNAGLLGVDVGIPIHPRVDAVFGFELSQSGGPSEYREYVETNDLPIAQDTKLRILPITGSLRLYLTPRGRKISRFAFVPAKIRAYTGAGGGLVWYEILQTGDFVDVVDLSIFTSTFRSSGWSFGAQAFGGLEVGLGTRWFVSFEGKYLWSKSDLGQDFVRFAPVDLSGARISIGINFLF